MDKKTLDTWHRLLAPELIGLEIMDIPPSPVSSIMAWVVGYRTRMINIAAYMTASLLLYV